MDEPQFLALIKERTLLADAEEPKWHIVLDIRNTNLSYSPGDTVAIRPENDPERVEKVLKALGAKGNEVIDEKNQQTLEEALLKRFDINTPKSEFFSLVPNMPKIENSHGVEELLSTLGPLPIDSFIKSLKPLFPRLYSIASCQQYVGDEIHLLIKEVHRGVTTNFLCRRSEVAKTLIPISIIPARHFHLPESDSAPIIMVAAGCGIAPYRGFLQEKISRSQTLENTWLFFGERHRCRDFLYGDFWLELQNKGMRLDLAFSRDQEEKVYVQDRLWHKRQEIYKWIEKGAFIYVCGDKKMGEDVDKTFKKIICEESREPEEKTQEYLRHLRRGGRYLFDIY
jgi:sulfite reductase (NADPH) flavoprotein alpha-component